MRLHGAGILRLRGWPRNPRSRSLDRPPGPRQGQEPHAELVCVAPVRRVRRRPRAAGAVVGGDGPRLLLLAAGGAPQVRRGAGRRDRAVLPPGACPRLLREYASFLELPNVASDAAGIERNAAWLVERLTAAGVRAELWRLPGANPVVWGELDVPGATRTLGIYVHYDGQPVEPASGPSARGRPRSRPLPLERRRHGAPAARRGEPVDPDWRLYARSASDDKAPLGALLPALARCVRPASRPPRTCGSSSRARRRPARPTSPGFSRPTAPSSTRWTAGYSSTARCTRAAGRSSPSACAA